MCDWIISVGSNTPSEPAALSCTWYQPLSPHVFHLSSSVQEHGSFTQCNSHLLSLKHWDLVQLGLCCEILLEVHMLRQNICDTEVLFSWSTNSVSRNPQTLWKSKFSSMVHMETLDGVSALTRSRTKFSLFSKWYRLHQSECSRHLLV